MHLGTLLVLRHYRLARYIPSSVLAIGWRPSTFSLRLKANFRMTMRMKMRTTMRYQLLFGLVICAKYFGLGKWKR